MSVTQGADWQQQVADPACHDPRGWWSCPQAAELPSACVAPTALLEQPPRAKMVYSLASRDVPGSAEHPGVLWFSCYSHVSKNLSAVRMHYFTP